VVVTKDLPGFISNRIFSSYLLNAVRLVQEEIATPGHRYHFQAGRKAAGPLETPTSSVSTVYNGAKAMYEELHDPQYAPPPLLHRMIKLGWLGRKTGKGFYDTPIKNRLPEKSLESTLPFQGGVAVFSRLFDGSTLVLEMERQNQTAVKGPAVMRTDKYIVTETKANEGAIPF
jgi:3-hydroxyacyl-CoA dehydrogenase